MKWLVLLVALILTLGIAFAASTLAYWGLTTPTFADCVGAGRPFSRQSQTYGRTTQFNRQGFSIDEGVKGISLRVQVKTRSLLPLGLGGKKGTVSWTLTDPSGTARWQDTTSAPSFDSTRQFDRLPGQWRFEIEMQGHSGGYATCLKPVQ